MRTTTKALAVASLAAMALAGTAGTAFAEPTSTPGDNSIVAVGSDTIQALADQFQADYTSPTAPAGAFYSYDAVPAGNITEKTGCSSSDVRPNGSGAGISALGSNERPSGDTTDYCVDIARSSRVPGSTDPKGLAWTQIATDAVTWSAESATNLPSSLTTAQLQEIYSCNDGSGNPVTESEIGGTGNDPVVPVIPQSSSGTRAFFLSKIGVTAPGSCVVPTDNTVEENEGSNAIFGRGSSYNTKDIVFPYSVAAYLSQTVHGNGDAFNNPGPLVLKSVGGVAPTSGSGSKTVINKKFPYSRQVFFVVRNAGTTSKPLVPTYLQSFLGTGKYNKKATGFVCSKAGQADSVDFGFLALGSKCGDITFTT